MNLQVERKLIWRPRGAGGFKLRESSSKLQLTSIGWYSSGSLWNEYYGGSDKKSEDDDGCIFNVVVAVITENAQPGLEEPPELPSKNWPQL